MTLLEVVVATAIGVAAAGVILEIFIQSNRQADAGMRKDRLVQQAGASLRILGARLERARAAQPAAEEVFKLDQIKIASLDPVSGERGVFEARLEPTGKNDAAIQSLWRWTGPVKDSPQDSSAWRPFGDDAGQPVKAFFRYAWAFKGADAALEPRHNAGGPPARGGNHRGGPGPEGPRRASPADNRRRASMRRPANRVNRADRAKPSGLRESIRCCNKKGQFPPMDIKP